MNWTDYQRQADATSAYTRQTTTERLTVAALGLVGETGELADVIKKAIGHGHRLDVDKIRDESGDALWYVAEIASALLLDLDEVAAGVADAASDGIDAHWLAVWALSLSGQVALIAEHVSDHLADPANFEIIPEYVDEVLNEVVSQLANLIQCAGLTLAEVAAHNQAKLAARYPDGFSSARSRARYEEQADDAV